MSEIFSPAFTDKIFANLVHTNKKNVLLPNFRLAILIIFFVEKHDLQIY